jgi:hypothetical protein
MIVAGSYAVIVLCLFILALVTRDEFGYRFIPVIYATWPLSFVLYKNSDIFFSILIGGGVNTVILFALLKGVAYITAPSGTK